MMIREKWVLGKVLLGVILLTNAVALMAADDQSLGAQAYYYEDISRFFAAHDRFLSSGEESAFAVYLEQGTRGLRDFEEHFSLSPGYLAETVQKYPKFFSSIRDVENVIRNRESEFNAMFGRLQALFPNHAMPNVYFLIGGGPWAIPGAVGGGFVGFALFAFVTALIIIRIYDNKRR